MKPVYIINGFLESGKTEFILYTLSQPYFQTKGTTLLILCEEGEIEYDEDILRRSRTIVEVVDEEAQMTAANMVALEKNINRSVLSSSTTACGILRISSCRGTGA